MILSILSSIVIFLMGSIFGFLMCALLSANNYK